MQQTKFGTIAWQDKMLKQIGQKQKAGKELDPYEQTFLHVQAEHNSRILEGESL